MKTKEQLIKYTEEKIQELNGDMKKFAEGILLNAAYELEWSNNTFERAAKLKGYIILLRALEKDISISEIREYFLKLVMDGARGPSFSTSPTTNLIAQYFTKACACLAEDLEEYVDGEPVNDAASVSDDK